MSRYILLPLLREFTARNNHKVNLNPNRGSFAGRVRPVYDEKPTSSQSNTHHGENFKDT